MIIAICSTWARVKHVISADDWFFVMMVAAFEILFELSLLVVVAL